MSKCTFREKPGAEELCPMMPIAGEEMCPRHKFLSEVAASKQDKREKFKARAIGHALPNTRRALITLGYSFRGSKACSSCGKHIEWWNTPAEKMAPYNVMPDEDSKALSHFATCEFAAQHRKAS